VASTSPGSGSNPSLPTQRIYQLAVEDGGFDPSADSKLGGYSPAEVATAIAIAESQGQPGAHGDLALGPSGSYGLWQIFSGAWTPGDVGLAGGTYQDLYNPISNARAAGIVYKKQGFKAWSTYNSGAYKLYLPQVAAAAKQDATDGATAEFISGQVQTNPQGAITGGTGGVGAAKDLGSKALGIITTPLDWMKSFGSWIQGGVIRAAYFIGGGLLLLVFIWKAGAK
jgi:hypothetical protein